MEVVDVTEEVEEVEEDVALGGSEALVEIATEKVSISDETGSREDEGPLEMMSMSSMSLEMTEELTSELTMEDSTEETAAEETIGDFSEELTRSASDSVRLEK